MTIYTDLEIKAFIRDFIKNSDKEDWNNIEDLLNLYLLKLKNRKNQQINEALEVKKK